MWIESAQSDLFVRAEDITAYTVSPNSNGYQYQLEAKTSSHVGAVISLTHGTREFCLGELKRIVKAERTAGGKDAPEFHKVNPPGKEQEREPKRPAPEPSAGEIARGIGLTSASRGR